MISYILSAYNFVFISPSQTAIYNPNLKARSLSPVTINQAIKEWKNVVIPSLKQRDMICQHRGIRQSGGATLYIETLEKFCIVRIPLSLETQASAQKFK